MLSLTDCEGHARARLPLRASMKIVCFSLDREHTQQPTHVCFQVCIATPHANTLARE